MREQGGGGAGGGGGDEGGVRKATRRCDCVFHFCCFTSFFCSLDTRRFRPVFVVNQ